MYGNSPQQRVRLNLKTQLGPSRPPFFPQQRFPRPNSPQRWTPPVQQNQFRNKLPNSRESHLPSPNSSFNLKNQSFARNSPPVTNSFNDLQSNPKLVSRKSSEFGTSINNTRNSSPDVSQTSNSPHDPYRYSRGFQHETVKDSSSPSAFSTNVSSGLKNKISLTLSSSRSVIPGLDEYDDDETEYADTHSSATEKSGHDFNANKWGRHDSIPFLGESNNSVNISGSSYSSNSHTNSKLCNSYNKASAKDTYKDQLRKKDGTFQDLKKKSVSEDICSQTNSNGDDGGNVKKSDSSKSESSLEQALDILNNGEAIVGLDYVIEYKDNLSSSGSLSFCCTLCNSAISRQSIVNHIMGGKHRLRYLKVKDEKKHHQLSTLTIEAPLKEFAIAQSSLELEKMYGRGKVKIELKIEGKPSLSPSGEEVYSNCRSDAVLSLYDIPIVSETHSPQYDYPKPSISKAKDDSSSPYDKQETKKSQDDAKSRAFDDKTPHTHHQSSKISSVYSTDLSSFDKQRASASKNSRKTDSPLSSSTDEAPVQDRDFRQSQSPFKYSKDRSEDKLGNSDYPFSSRPSLQSTYCTQDTDRYNSDKRSLSPLITSSDSQPFTMQASGRLGSPMKLPTEETGVKRSTSHGEESAKKFMKTNSKFSDADGVNPSDVFRQSVTDFPGEENAHKFMKTDRKSASFANLNDPAFLNQPVSSFLNSQNLRKFLGTDIKSEELADDFLQNSLHHSEKFNKFSEPDIKSENNARVMTPDNFKQAAPTFLSANDNAKKCIKTELLYGEDSAASLSDSFHAPHAESNKSFEEVAAYSSPLSVHNSPLINPECDLKSSMAATVKSELESKPERDLTCRNIEMSPSEVCSSDTKMVIDRNVESVILENLSKCSISTEGEAAIVLQAITVLTEMFIKYKLQHVSGDTVELFIKSLHAGQTQGIQQMLGHFDTDRKDTSSSGTKEEPDSSDKKPSIQDESQRNTISVQHEVSNVTPLVDHKTILGGNDSSTVKEFNAGNCTPMDTGKSGSLNPGTLLGAQECHVGNTVAAETAVNTEAKNNSLHSESLRSTMDSRSIMSSVQEKPSTPESLQPPPFFTQPSTSQQWSNESKPSTDHNQLSQSNWNSKPSTDHNQLSQSNWNSMPYQAPAMSFPGMPYYQMYPTMGQQFMGMPQHAYAYQQHFAMNQHFGNQQMYQNMGQLTMQQPPLPPSEPHPPLPPSEPHPPLPPSEPHLPRQLLSALSTPQPPPPPPLPPH